MKKLQVTAILTGAALLLAPVCLSASPIYAEAAPKTEAASEKDTLSTIASISKVFATTAVLQLADEGKVDIDKPVTEYLPDFRMADSRYKDITVRMLMNHSSGLMGTTAADFMLFEDRDAAPHDLLLSRLKNQRLKADPGDFGAYCNDGFTLLELITEEVSGESFTDYIEKHICQPLGMEQTGTVWNAFQTDEQVPTYFGKVHFGNDYCMAIGSGGILSTAPELCTFGTAFFKGNTKLLSEEAKSEMNLSYARAQYEDGFGLGWDIVDYPDYSSAGVQVVSKGGDIQSQHGELLVAPDEKISVAVLSSGGSSTVDNLFGQALMDIALRQKGIEIHHSQPTEVETLAEIPESCLSHAGLYTSGSSILQVSFPDRKYMEIKDLSSEKESVSEYLYTADDRFVLMDGKISSGKAVQDKSQQFLSFRKRNGRDYICQDILTEQGALGTIQGSNYYAQRLPENKVSSDVQKSWDDRNNQKYYLYSEKYSSTSYMAEPYIEIKTIPDAMGYVNSLQIKDSTHAESILQMPGGRDQSDYELRQENGAEFLSMTAHCIDYISEDAIPELTADLRSVPLHTKQASWYRISDSMKKTTVTLDIPAHAAVYIYDKYDGLTYSSYMKDYGNSVTLPEGGKIVFLGENGSSISIL